MREGEPSRCDEATPGHAIFGGYFQNQCVRRGTVCVARACLRALPAACCTLACCAAVCARGVCVCAQAGCRLRSVHSSHYFAEARAANSHWYLADDERRRIYNLS